MSVSAITRQIGTYVKAKEQRGIRYTFKHHVMPDDLSSYDLNYGDALSEDIFVCDTTGLICLGQTIVGAGSFGYDLITTGVNANYVSVNPQFIQNVDYQSKSFSNGTFYCDPKFWGLRIATSTDVFEQIKSRTMNGACKVGDWLHKKATANDFGDVDMTACPIGTSVGSPFPDTYSYLVSGKFDWHGASGFLNKNLTTSIMKVRYVTSKTQNHAAAFDGINPTGFANTPSALQPPDAAMRVKGVWKAAGQTVREVLIKGELYNIVTRTMIAAPKVKNGLQTAWLAPANEWTW